MDYKKLVETALLAGTIMLESNAETYRVEETVQHILKVSKLEYAEAFVLPTGLMISLDGPNIEAISLNKRVKNRSTDLSKIHHVNHISRQMVAGVLSIDEAHTALKAMTGNGYSPLSFYLANILLAVSFTIMLGGNLYDGLVTFLNSLFLISIMAAGKKLKTSLFFINLVSSIIIAVLGTLALECFPSHLNLDSIIVGSIMPMVPGTLLTNAIRDTFRGDYTAGLARAIEAIFIALSISLGVAIGLILMNGGYLLQ